MGRSCARPVGRDSAGGPGQLRLLGARAAALANDAPRMVALYAPGEADARARGDEALLSRVLFGRGDAALQRGDLEEANDAFERAHELAATAGDQWGFGFALSGRVSRRARRERTSGQRASSTRPSSTRAATKR